ncbi:MAG: YHS domain-containing (seleno)protein [Sphingosinicella sp.]|uniref:YHS domain-containing (seleno)protein n=1 Tax=Sphingosinicella sp. TaxID=1917971 RepID=UPI004037E7C4
MRKLLALLIALAAPATAVAAVPAPAVSATQEGVAIGGYDAVAYFSEGRPVRGSAEFAHRWNGAEWRFASAAARDRFAADPESYAPAFGGYCAWAVSQNYLAPGDPLVWRIVDGRLYLNFNARAKELWEADLAGAIARGMRNWPSVLETADNR